MTAHPECDGAWADAKRRSPSRSPYTDPELIRLRITYDPENREYGADHQEATVIWTLLDMIEAEKGWSPAKSICEQVIDCSPLREPVPSIEWYDDVPPEPTASAEEAFQGPREPLSLTISGPPPTLDAEILQQPPPLPELIDTLKTKLREVPSVAAAMDAASTVSALACSLCGGDVRTCGHPEMLARCSCCSDPEPAADDEFYSAPWCGRCGHPGAAHAREASRPVQFDDDDEFRRRRDESAERYTRPDGSER